MKGLFTKVGLGLIVFMALSYGCASDPFVHNIKSKSELKGDQKVLAGRFACFENDAPVHCTKSDFFIFFNREGELESKLLKPDDAGYIYIAVTEGYYNIATFAKGIKEGKGLVFDLDPFPVVLVRSEDSVVNFGTLEVRFYDRPVPKGASTPGAADRPQLRINHIANYDITRSEIASRVGKFAGAISDGSVEFMKRARR
ncbi:MAG: hypothetical protein ACUVWO_12225 [Thermodesulfobacteriota bacterium]